MRRMPEEPGGVPDPQQDLGLPTSGIPPSRCRAPVGFLAGLFRGPGSFLGLVLGIVAVGGLMPIQAEAPRAVRVTGTMECVRFDREGHEQWPLDPVLAFEADIDERGRWRIRGAYPEGPKPRTGYLVTDEQGKVRFPPWPNHYEHGFDGTDTYVVHSEVDDVLDRHSANDPSQPNMLTRANIFRGDEFPFRAYAGSYLEWFVLASFGYQQDPGRAGHVPALLRSRTASSLTDVFSPDVFDSVPFHRDPLPLALKVRSTFRAEWPRFVEQAEFFLDPRGMPRPPFGLTIPTDADEAQEMDARWKALLAKGPGTRVGRLTSSEPRDFGGRVFLTKYRLDLTWRSSLESVHPSSWDHPMTRMELKIDRVQDLAQEVVRPRPPAEPIEVADYRFREVDQDRIMRDLSYTMKGRWRSPHEFSLRLQAALEHLTRPRIVRVADSTDSVY